MLSDYQRQLCDRFLAAPVMPAPEPWRPAAAGTIAVGGLLGVGFAPDPDSGEDLLMVVSHDGYGLFDTATGTKIARDRDPDLELPDGPDLACPGPGPLARAGVRVPIAGLFGGGLHTVADRWVLDVVSPEWPNDRVLLSTGGGPWRGSAGETWWHIFHSDYSELRAAGFSASGRSLVVATSSDITLWTRAGN
ncbi:hypothetical protein [Catenulispora pinisilvae]|uniref:hypothetical protein n=1 Tax=Catenulispora pinisilvae TaxID=2705253 RepID=UPI0018913B04|nr:hypothetical protein [Catenulispora pinisilvae]